MVTFNMRTFAANLLGRALPPAKTDADRQEELTAAIGRLRRSVRCAPAVVISHRCVELCDFLDVENDAHMVALDLLTTIQQQALDNDAGQMILDDPAKPWRKALSAVADAVDAILSQE